MKITGETVSFETCDIAFVRKFGLLEAARQALAHRDAHPELPFLMDDHQLSAFLAIGRKTLYQLARQTKEAYHPVQIPKKGGGVRQLFVPEPRLRRIQDRIYRHILIHLPISHYATAYRTGGSLRDNAAPHVGRRYVLKLDVADFFGSIHHDQVLRVLSETPGLSRQTAWLLSELCCLDGVLPQGAPTSPALSNLVLDRMDRTLGCWCQIQGITYTRYCDDLTFSADCPLEGAYEKAGNLLRDMGFSLNEKKTRFLTRATRQQVTGLTVNEKVSVPNDYKRALRQELYYALRYGLCEAILGGKQTAFLRDGQPDPERYRAHLLGRVQYVLQIEPENKWFQEAKKRLYETEYKKEDEVWKS